MPHKLVCPTCNLALADDVARSPFQYCPRCLIRDRTGTLMRPEREPGRFAREAAVGRATDARAHLSTHPR